ncbi:MAG: hypothetical protein U0T56_05860 [Ferruginibacter sp.]
MNVGTPLIRTFLTVIGQTYYVRLSNAEYNIPEGGGFSTELRMGNSSASPRIRPGLFAVVQLLRLRQPRIMVVPIPSIHGVNSATKAQG